jgi:hypothetical protein
MFKHYLETVYNEYSGEYVYLDYYVGATSDIKALYKSILRSRTTNLMPAFCDFPKFSENKSVYALCIDGEGYVTIVNSDTMLGILINPEYIVEEV